MCANSVVLRITKLLTAFVLPWLSFFLCDVFLYRFTDTAGMFPLLFSAIWSAVFAALLFLLPRLPARICFFVLYELSAVYAILQAGYFSVFDKFMWLSDMAYMRDGAEFAGSIFNFLPSGFVVCAVLLLILGGIVCALRPHTQTHRPCVLAVGIGCVTALALLPYVRTAACASDHDMLGLGTDYYAGQSLSRAYDMMYDAQKVYAICGLYQTVGRDIGVHFIMPQLSDRQAENQQKLASIASYLDEYGSTACPNEMTGIFAGKNVIVVLMESADDWTLREDVTPTICKLMREGINFTNMYTPLYGSVRTFNSEFTLNTGIFSPTNGNLTFTYCSNTYSESLPNTFRRTGYTANAFHYNVETYYNRGIMDPAMGYENYFSYIDYAENHNTFSSELYEDSFVLTNPTLNSLLLDHAPFFNFVISRNAHLAYTKSDSVVKYALDKYPQYATVSDNEELCGYLAKMKLLDDFFADLLAQLEQKDLLYNTVIVGMTDHYSYSMKDQQKVLELSDVPVDLMVERTPFFLWSADGTTMEIDKTMSTIDVAPTLLNLFGMTDDYRYLGHDVFDPAYSGYAIFSDGSWIDNNIVYQKGEVAYEFYQNAAQHTDISAMNEHAQRLIETNNLILETDFYAP